MRDLIPKMFEKEPLILSYYNPGKFYNYLRNTVKNTGLCRDG